MKWIKPDCRAKLTEHDIAFIHSVLAKTKRERDFLFTLLGSEDERDRLLDDPAIYHALLESPDQLSVSLRFYFYILVRKTLREAGLDHRGIADYIATLMSDWTTSEQFHTGLKSEGRVSFKFASDLWTLSADTDERSRYDLLIFIGNHYLFMTGVFPEHIRHHARHRGGPRLRFYEENGRQGFKLAAKHEFAQRHHMNETFDLLAESFSLIRHALNDLSERQTFISS